MELLPKRKPNRLTGYDYSQPGCYFITICTAGRQPILRRGAQCAPASEIPPLTEIGEIRNGQFKVFQIIIRMFLWKNM